MDNFHDSIEEDDGNKHDDDCESCDAKENVKDDNGTSNKGAIDLFEILQCCRDIRRSIMRSIIDTINNGCYYE